jgi:Ca2+-transporting ATPase
MFNALNALSEDGSILVNFGFFILKHVGIFCNPILIGAIFISMILHCMILYVPFFEAIFNTVPLNYNDWKLVFYVSFPVN